MPIATVTICNKKGLHARAAAKFVKTVANFEAEVQVARADAPDAHVTGSSILGLMMLGADLGTALALRAEGTQAEAVLAALVELVDTKFGEGE